MSWLIWERSRDARAPNSIDVIRHVVLAIVVNHPPAWVGQSSTTLVTLPGLEDALRLATRRLAAAPAWRSGQTRSRAQVHRPIMPSSVRRHAWLGDPPFGERRRKTVRRVPVADAGDLAFLPIAGEAKGQAPEIR